MLPVRRARAEERHHGDAGGDLATPARRGVARERGEEHVHRRVAVLCAPGEPAREHREDPRRDLPRRGGVHLPELHRQHQRIARGASEGALSGEGLEERDTEAELIGARVHRPRQMLLGGHVERRPLHGAIAGHGRPEQVSGGAARRLGESLGARSARGVGEAEVGDARLGRGRIDEHVLRLEVAMNQPCAMRRREPAAGRHEHRDHGLLTARRPATPRAQRAPLDVLHRQEDAARVLAEVVDGDDVGMADARHRLRLAHQADAGRLAAHGEELERHGAVQQRIVRGNDVGHPAAPDGRKDHVAPDERARWRDLARRPIDRGRRRDADRVGVVQRVREDRGRRAPFLRHRGPVLHARRRSARSPRERTSADTLRRGRGYPLFARAHGPLRAAPRGAFGRRKDGRHPRRVFASGQARLLAPRWTVRSVRARKITCLP